MKQRTLPLLAATFAILVPLSASAQYDHPHPDQYAHRAQSPVLQIAQGTRVVDASGMSHVTQVGYVPPSVEVLILRGTQVRQLPHLPSGLRVLNISRTQIRHVPWLPQGLREFRARNSQLQQISYLPQGLQTLDLSGSPIVRLPNLPANLSVLDVSRTPMQTLPALPARLVELRVRGSHIQLGYLPASVRVDVQQQQHPHPQQGHPQQAQPQQAQPRRDRWSREWNHRRQRRQGRARVSVRRRDGNYRRSWGYTNVWDSGWERRRRQRAF